MFHIASRAASAPNDTADNIVPTLPAYYHKLTTFVCECTEYATIKSKLDQKASNSSADIDARVIDGNKIRLVAYEDSQQVDMTGYLFQDNEKYHFEFQRQSGCAILFSKIYAEFETEFAEAPLPRSTSFEAPALKLDDTCAPFTHCNKPGFCPVDALVQHSLNGTPQLAIESLSALCKIISSSNLSLTDEVKAKLASVPKHFLENPLEDERDVVIRACVFKLIAALADQKVIAPELLNEAMAMAVKSASDTTNKLSADQLSLAQREVLRQLACAAFAVKNYTGADATITKELLDDYVQSLNNWPRANVCKTALIQL